MRFVKGLPKLREVAMGISRPPPPPEKVPVDEGDVITLPS